MQLKDLVLILTKNKAKTLGHFDDDLVTWRKTPVVRVRLSLILTMASSMNLQNIKASAEHQAMLLFQTKGVPEIRLLEQNLRFLPPSLPSLP